MVVRQYCEKPADPASKIARQQRWQHVPEHDMHACQHGKAADDARGRVEDRLFAHGMASWLDATA